MIATALVARSADAQRAGELLLDDLASSAQASLAVHRIVTAPTAETYAAAKSLNLLEVRTPLLVASFWVRGLPARCAGRLPAPPPRLALDGDAGLPGWMILGERVGYELDFGAVGVFWTPVIRWNTEVRPEAFADFDEPGWGKVACAYTTIPFGSRRTLLTYECRTSITDVETRARFERYWWLVRPFVRHVMRATVRTIATHAEAGG